MYYEFYIFMSLPVWNGADNALHHSKMLPVVMRLEKSDAEIEFENDASDAPNVTRLAPAKLCK